MDIVAFAPFRFSPADLNEFAKLASPKLAIGYWTGVERKTERSSDKILVKFHGVDRVLFSFERDKSGLYHMWYHDRDGLFEISKGKSAYECLSAWEKH